MSLKRIVLTGGPGAGKSSVLEVMRGWGISIGEDIARVIIRERKSAGLSPRPDSIEFAKQILVREVARFDSLVQQPTFYERGVVEAVTFL